MPKCIITRTHRLGLALRDRDFDPAVAGPIEMYSIRHPVLKRDVQVLKVVRNAEGGADIPLPIPELFEPKWITFSTERAMMVTGFEDLGGRKYYQGWWIQWE